MTTKLTILAALSIMLGCANAVASDLTLTKIRVADHDGRARVALEFEGAAKPKGRVSVADDKLVVELEGVRPAKHVEMTGKAPLITAYDVSANANGAPVVVVKTRVPTKLAAAPTVLPEDKKSGPRLYFDIEQDSSAPAPRNSAGAEAVSAPAPKPAAPALAELQAAAKSGNVQAQMALAAALAKQEKPDFTGALQWYIAAAETGNAPAAYNVAQYMRMGRGTPANLPMAFQWYERSAAGDFPPAQVALAILLIEGEGIPRDQERAHFLLQKAAGAGNPQAQAILEKLDHP